jgi:hypothetical protein
MNQTGMVTVTGLLFVNAIMGFLHMIPWTAVFILLRQFGLYLYIIKNKETCVRAQKRIQNYSSHMTDEDKGYGYSAGYWYIVYIDVSDNDNGNYYTMWFIGTEASFKNLTASADEIHTFQMGVEAEPRKEFTVFERIGSLHNTWFRKRRMPTLKVVPDSSQESVIEQIKAQYEKTRHVVALICGPPGTGKSMIGLLLANQYKSAFCNTLKPWQPGDTFGSLYSEVEPSAESPMIIGFDEVDTVITKVNYGIPSHKILTTQIQDKSGWNSFFDTIQRGLYPNVIVIMTSNRSAEYIRSIDPSYIREKRVDLLFDMDVTI